MAECRYYGKCAGACDGHGLCVSFRNATYECEDIEPMPDVDALLALAEEMERSARESDAYFAGIYPEDVIGYACRIRDALGVER